MGSQEEGCFALYKIRPVPRQRVQRPQKPIGCPEERSGEAPPHVGVLDKINGALSAVPFFSRGGWRATERPGEGRGRERDLRGIQKHNPRAIIQVRFSMKDIFLASIKSSQIHFQEYRVSTREKRLQMNTKTLQVFKFSHSGASELQFHAQSLLNSILYLSQYEHEHVKAHPPPPNSKSKRFSSVNLLWYSFFLFFALTDAAGGPYSTERSLELGVVERMSSCLTCSKNERIVYYS